MFFMNSTRQFLTFSTREQKGNLREQRSTERNSINMHKNLVTDSHRKLIYINSPKSLRTELKWRIVPSFAQWTLGSTQSRSEEL